MLRLHVFGGFLALALIYVTKVIADENVKECSPYPFVSLDHGHIRRLSYQKYHFSCDRGHLLVTPSIVRCFRGNWTSLKEPKCIKSEGDCEDPPEVDNAIIHGEDREIGSLVQYTCKPGFQLVGKGVMSCTSTRHWDGRTPTCMDEKEPIQKVADRLKKSFVNELSIQPEDDESESNDTLLGIEGRILDRESLKHGLDLVLVIDRSSSVDPVDLETAKNFINFLLRKFDVRNERNKKNGTQAALLTFGTEVQIVFNVNNYNITGPLAASQAVGTIEPNGGGTNIEGALTMVIIQVTPLLRKRSKKALFLMTDGVPNIANPGITAEDMALTLRNDYNFEIFTVGIGKDINRNLLAEIASRPPLSHVFILSDYPDLKELMKIIEEDLPPPPPISENQCGYHEPRGRSNPWVAFLYISGGGGLRKMRMCQGVLICSQWVLTAASCLLEGEERIPKEEIFVTLGDNDILKDEQNQTNFYVLEVNLHNKFDPSEPLYNNLALVKLNIPADRYRPVCLPKRETNKPLYLALLTNTSIVGCGMNAATPTYPTGATVKIKVTLKQVSLAQEDDEFECPEKEQNMPLFCAGQGRDTCLGLMGSPIIALDPETKYNHALGIVAGRAQCLKGRNQYIELTKHIKWINHSTDSCQLKHWD